MARPHFRLEAVPMTVTENPVMVGYLSQVLNHLLLGLLMAAAGALTGMTTPLGTMVASHPFIGFLGMFGLLMWASAAAHGPRAGLAYYVFTFAMGLLMAPVVAVTLMKYNGLQTLMLAGGITVVNTVALSAYALISKRNFNFLGGFLMVGLITMIVAMLLNAYWLQSSFMEMVIPGILVLLFNGFILYDLSRILHSPVPIPATAAALSLFLDIFNLFMAYLRIFDRD